ncbi:transcriptional repressor [Tropicibacter sp. R16_0]|uniref:Fur family transcriptional regulator n=1 Tax=Tropicibacter sp. R16_0 TaxID=2821102 RepID=UPI001ADB278C|nr:transcriptional repressor [Tropicibacter sp. R16_0]MBO9449152.1 transcriptional repressor [Tropicibacter sp. R16_0]
MSTIGFSEHDHGRCIHTAMTQAETYCATNKLHFTPVRRRVLEILLSKHQAMGAYDILAVLAEEGMGSQPPVAYRALDFLVQNGFVHRIERLNAYTACAHPNHDHIPAFLICRECKAVAEADSEVSHGDLSHAAKDTGFTIEKIVVEAEGICPACSGRA